MTSASVPPASAPANPLLRGRAFYESIGSPKFVVAPMVDQSEFAWRMLTRSFLTPEENSRMLAYTPMFHARLFGDAGNAKYRDQHLQVSVTADSEPVLPTTPEAAAETKPYLDGNPTFDRPLFVQFCANDPDHLLSAAKLAAPYCDAIDLNLGCPQGIARKGHYGAFLQEDQELVHKLIRTLHEGGLGVPVTAKIRILGTKEDTLRYAQNVLSAGASIITVHGRRREQKGHLTGVADWDYIRHLRDNLPPETVIFANGNILEHGDVERCLAATGADAVMSAEGNLSDPAIFARPPPVGQEGREYWRGACGSGSGEDGETAAVVVGGYRVDAVFRRYMDIMHRHVLGQEPPARRPLFVVGDDEAWLDETASDNASAGAEAGEEGPAKKKRKTDSSNKNKNNKAAAASANSKQRTTSPNLGAMRPHLFHLLRHFVALHTDIRDSLARCRAGDVDAAEAVLDLVERRVARGLIDYERTGGESIRSYMQSTAKPAKADPVVAAAAAAAAVDTAPDGNNGVNSTTTETNGIATISTNGTSSARQEQPPPPPPPPAHEDAGESSLETVRACKRPWWVCQPIVRPLPAEALAKGSIQLSKKQQKALSSSAAAVTPAPIVSAAPAAAVDTVVGTLPKADGVDGIEEPRMDPKQPGPVSDDLVCG
ncbi:tRNA-dihydrouridine synthase 1 [Microdochium nivale]|nr:tRNA-dihydrouridine synthase 1 [Microdochium nivale]